MVETRFTSEASEPPADMASLWPFPGLLLLVVFAAWLFYMGSIAGMEDVTNAFYGLGAVTVFVLLLGLRAVAAGRVRRHRAVPAAPPRRRRHAERAGALGDDPFAVPRRSAIVDEAAAPAEGAIYPGVSPATDLPLAARMRARQEELRASPPLHAVETDEDSRHPQRLEPTDAPFESTDSEAEEPPEPAAERRPLVAEPLPSRDEGGSGGRSGQMWAALRQLESWLNRERAERGAQVAKLEALLKAEADSLRALIRSGEPAPADGEAAPVSAEARDLAEKVDALATRISALEAQTESLANAREGEGFMKLTQFNTAINGQLLPRIVQMIDKRVAAAVAPEALRRSLGLGELDPASAARPAESQDGTLGERIASAHAAISAANEASQAEREAIRSEMEKLQRSVQRALGAAMNARRAVGEVAEGDSTVAEQIAELRSAMGRGAGAIAAPEAVEGRIAEVMREVEQLRGNLGAVTQHIARMGEHYRDLLDRLDRIGEQLSPDARPAAGSGSGGVQAEVEALRDALTTIIEQNREIRAQQEMLSARFDKPGRPEG